MKQTAEEARTFERFSIGNATTLARAAVERGCECRPYEDWYTYNRWLAQGMQVQKDEHGVKLGVIVRQDRKQTQEDGTEKTTTVSRPWTTTVFCRCQVKPRT